MTLSLSSLRRLLPLAFLLILALSFVACGTPKNLAYFSVADSLQQLTPVQLAQYVKNQQASSLHIQKGDVLSIVVSSALTPDATLSFNQLVAANKPTQSVPQPTLTNALTGFVVNSEGKIIFPMLGVLPAEGLTPELLEAHIASLLQSKRLLRDAKISVSIMNRYVSVLGEVNEPSRVNLSRENLTLLQALNEAGDLTIKADRSRVMVLRAQGDSLRSYTHDLTKRHELFASPAYQLQAGDVVYVQPNKTRQRESHEHGNALHQPDFYIALTTTLLSLVTTLIAIF